MNRNLITAGLGIAALALSACSDHEGRMVNNKICANFKAANTGQTGVPAMPVADAASPVDECVRRWAYSLAGARDNAEVVADASVAACAAALTRWNQGALNQQSNANGDGASEGLSITTGLPTNPISEHSNFARGRALFYVVQARAGRCAPPPAVNGVPAGT